MNMSKIGRAGAPASVAAQIMGTKTQQSNWFYCTDPISFLSDDAFLAPSACAGRQEKVWAPSQRGRKHQEAPMGTHAPQHNNQNVIIVFILHVHFLGSFNIAKLSNKNSFWLLTHATIAE
jgi:hypothetical protein